MSNISSPLSIIKTTLKTIPDKRILDLLLLHSDLIAPSPRGAQVLPVPEHQHNVIIGLLIINGDFDDFQ